MCLWCKYFNSLPLSLSSSLSRSLAHPLHLDNAPPCGHQHSYLWKSNLRPFPPYPPFSFFFLLLFLNPITHLYVRNSTKKKSSEMSIVVRVCDENKSRCVMMTVSTCAWAAFYFEGQSTPADWELSSAETSTLWCFWPLTMWHHMTWTLITSMLIHYHGTNRGWSWFVCPLCPLVSLHSCLVVSCSRLMGRVIISSVKYFWSGPFVSCSWRSHSWFLTATLWLPFSPSAFQWSHYIFTIPHHSICAEIVK